MTTRIKGFWVALDHDIREDDFESIKTAVLMIKGVSEIKESVSSSDDYFNRSQIRRDLISKIYDVLLEK